LIELITIKFDISLNIRDHLLRDRFLSNEFI